MVPKQEDEAEEDENPAGEREEEARDESGGDEDERDERYHDKIGGDVSFPPFWSTSHRC